MATEVPQLFIGGVDLSERIVTLSVVQTRPSRVWIRVVDRLIVDLGGQDPLVVGRNLVRSDFYEIRASLDGRKWWEGSARVVGWPVQVVGWDNERAGHRLEMHGQFHRPIRAARATPW